MRLANVFNLGVKELRSLRRDPIMAVLIIYSFTLAVIMAASAMPETLHNAPIAIVDEDHSNLSNRIVDAFFPPLFQPPALINWADMDAGMDAGRFTFALDIPPDFERDVLAGHHPRIQLNIDATRMTQAFTGNWYVQTIVNGEVDAFAQRHRLATALPVKLDLRVKFNPNLYRPWYTGVAELINQITLLSIVLTGAALIREREHGTIEHLLVMPVTPFEIMISKVWSMGLVVVIASAFSIPLIIQGFLAIPVGRVRAALSGRHGPDAVRHHLHGNFPGHPRTDDAAIRHADASRVAPSDNALGRLYPPGEHARDRAKNYVDRPQHAFRHARPGHLLSRRRDRYCLAAVPCPVRHWRYPLRPCPGSLPEIPGSRDHLRT